MGGHQFIEGRAGFVNESSTRLENGLLMEQGGAGPGVQAELPFIGVIETRQDAQQSGLAGTVRTHEADTVAGAQLEADIREQGAFVESSGQSGTAHEQHRRAPIPS
jgi:hypothetical protein